MPGTLIYLSHCAVDASGKPNPFMAQELPWLHQHFERVLMVSCNGVRTLHKDDAPPLYTIRPALSGFRSWLRAPFMPDLWRELARLIRGGRFSLTNALKLLAFIQRALKMHQWCEWLMRDGNDANTTLYSCWMSWDGYAAALSKTRHPKARLVVRGHAFDIDEERNPMNPYLMKRRIAREADGLYLISQTAMRQYMAYMEGHVAADKLHVLAMGSGGQPMQELREPPLYTQGVLRVVSCAMIIPIKQVEVMVEALAQWDGCPLCWTHIGGGEGEEALHALVEQKLDAKENVICELLGTQDSAAVQRLYETRAFDVFVNTSRKEGVPVSIMEAMRFGIPAIAPRVGGIPELVTPQVGYLYEHDAEAKNLLACLRAFAQRSRAEADAMRMAAKRRWEEHFCSAVLLERLFAPQGEAAHKEKA